MPLFLPSGRIQRPGRRGADVAPYTFVPYGAGLVDVGNGQAAVTALSGAQAHRGPAGEAVRFSGGGYSATPGVTLDFDVGVSGVILFSPDTALAKATLIALNGGTGTYQFALNSSGGIQADRQQQLNLFSTADQGIRANGVVHCAAFQAIAGGNTTAALNGRVIGSGTVSGLTGGITTLHIARRQGDTTEALTGKVYGVWLFPYSIGLSRLCAYTANPGLLVGSRRVWVPVSAAADGSTGTSATTNANDTSSASGTTTVTGTSARTNANDTSSASGTTTVLGTSATTNANDSPSVSGTTAVLGTLARTNADDASSASGSVGNSVGGSSATTNANDAGSASGTTTVTGTSARTNANDAAAAAGTTTVLGALARTNANDTAAASGVAGVVTGTAAATNAPDTATASGTAGAAPAPAPAATGGGWAWAASRKKRHDYLSPPTREQMAERVRKQREALGILPKPAQKRIEAAAKKAARKPEPSLAPLAPLAVEVAQDSGVALQQVIDAISAVYERQRGLVAARMEADAAERREAEAMAAEQARAEAEAQEMARQAAEEAWQQRLPALRAADEEMLKRADAERQQAIKTIRQVQKALLALIS